MTCPRCGGEGWYISRAAIRLECECGAWDRKVRAMARADAADHKMRLAMMDAGIPIMIDAATKAKTFRCVTVCQPWASGIVASDKDIENRTWYTSHRGPLLIHAGMSKQWFGSRGVNELPGLGRDEDLPRGLIIGVVTMTGCVPVAEVAGRKYAEGPYCWLLSERRQFERPIAYTGAQGLFSVPADLVAAQMRSKA